MKTKLVSAVALALLASASSVAFAQAKQQTSGWYVGGSLGRSNTDFNSADFAANTAGVVESKDDSDTAYKFLVGYDFDQNWALEGAYTNLGEPKYKYSGTFLTVVGSAQAKIKNDAWSLSVKGTLPINQQFDIFGRLGWTYNRSEMNGSAVVTWPGFFTVAIPSENHNRSDALFGLGVEFKPQKNWGIRAEYENYGRFGNSNNTGRTDTDMWSLGVVIRF